MKRFITGIILYVSLFIFFNINANATSNFQNETLNYTITYKWGLIHKDAAKATMRLINSGDAYKITLTAKTLPWADKIFSVRDTLISNISKNNFRVKNYIKTTHEGDRYAKDIINFSYGGSAVKGSVKKYRQKKSEPMSVNSLTHTATGLTFDMLSVFYYLRTLDFENMATNHIHKVNILSGSHAEILTIRYAGIETIKLRNNTKVQAYKLKFSFTSDGKKKSSENMTAYISKDGKNIPLYLVGKLPIGEVRVYLD